MMKRFHFAIFSVLLFVCLIRAGAQAEDDWWEYGHFYQIYPRSFQDSDGDGIGDLRGITSRLTYLKFINVTGIWLSPIFQSPMKDFGYDISDFRKIQPEYGTMKDFEELAARCKELDIKLILDFVPNHCSNEHEWFKKATNRSDPEHKKYKDYFIWHNGKVSSNGTRAPPSNWLSVFRGSAWEWIDDMKAYYYHQFLEEQPDLNFRNLVVVEEMKEILRFWLRHGVSGFRVDAVPHIFETKENSKGYYNDEPPSGICQDDPQASCYLNHTETKDLDETYDMVYQWRRVLEEDEFKDYTKILMTEGYSTLDGMLKYYGRIENGRIVNGIYGAQIPFNFLLLSNTHMETGTWGYKWNIEDWLKNMPKGNKIQANWVLGNHDNKRVASKYKPSRTDLFNILIKTLPGITITYYACRTDKDRYENASRDPERTPFQWDNSKNAGFSSGDKMWLPLAKNYTECNVEQQLQEKRSFLKTFGDLMALRQNPTIKYGELEIEPVDEEVLVYKREIKNKPEADIVAVVLNLGGNTKTVNLNNHLNGLPAKMKTVVASIHSTIAPGDVVDTKNVIISPDAGIVIIGKK